jgi:hypothetical protein
MISSRAKARKSEGKSSFRGITCYLATSQYPLQMRAVIEAFAAVETAETAEPAES